MNKSVLIFGAGLNQYLLIKAVKELGLVSVVIDPMRDAPGRYISDFFYVVAGNDYEMTKEIALKHNIAGLVTTQIEKPLRLMAKLAKDIDLQFHSSDVVERSLDKWLMKETFMKCRVPCARGKLYKVDEIIQEADIKEFRYPLILKPKDGTSSQGVIRIKRFNEIERYIDNARRFSKDGEIIIEEFLEGPEYSIETITFRGQTTIIQYTEKFITPFPHTVEIGHLQPAELSAIQKNEIDEVVKAAIKAIGIDNSASHTEIKLTKKGAKVLEIGARGGGDFIASYLTLTSTGVNMDKAIVQVALNQEPYLQPTQQFYSYIKYFELPVGKKVLQVDEWQDILREEAVVFANIAIKSGDVVEEITESRKRPGFVIVKGTSRDDVINKGSNYISLLKQKIILQ